MDQPLFPKARMNLVRPARPVTAHVVANDLCMRGKSASFVKHLVLDVGDTPLAGAFLPGQSFGVIAPGVDSRGAPHKVRLYSIASPSWGEDGTARFISTTPKRLIDEFEPPGATGGPEDHRLFLGICSNYLCDLKPGDPVPVSGPNGKRFVLPDDVSAHDYLFIATGTGIAPFRGMILELLEAPGGPCRSRVDLVMGAPYTTDLLYDDLFRRLEERHPNFHYHTAISREAFADTGRGRYVTDCIRNQKALFLPRLADDRTLIYLCGILGMQFGLFKTLAEFGVESGYAEIHPPLRDLQPGQWSHEAMKRHIKPTPRCLLELY